MIDEEKMGNYEEEKNQFLNDDIETIKLKSEIDDLKQQNYNINLEK